ncbi:MAG: Ribbon-helix-helix domain [Pseudomonadota bacterium]|jgi:predicted DNA-binding protein
MKRHNMFLPDELVAEARKLAQKRGVPLADVVRTALEKYLMAVRKAAEAKNGPQ